MNNLTNTLNTDLSIKDMTDERLLDGIEISMLKEKFEKRHNNIRFELDYPLSKKYNGFIESAECWWDVLSAICAAYKIIYKNEEYYGVWGHEIGDLMVECLCLKDDKLEIYIGS